MKYNLLEKKKLVGIEREKKKTSSKVLELVLCV